MLSTKRYIPRRCKNTKAGLSLAGDREQRRGARSRVMITTKLFWSFDASLEKHHSQDTKASDIVWETPSIPRGQSVLKRHGAFISWSLMMASNTLALLLVKRASGNAGKNTWP